MPAAEDKMINNKAFDEVTQTITRLLPEGAWKLQKDLESNIRAALQSGLAKMNLVTREEFDIQAALLERSREKLDKLEQQLSHLLEDKQ
jgi:ubiquinone biosynthesis accessory factor UbiK